MQLRELREYCQRRGLQIVEEFIDKGGSGSKDRRPHWDDSEGGEITDANEEQAILSRLETALKAKIGDYELAREAS